jgi:cell division protein FtsI/penicillin-binding protein 2
MGYKKSHSYKSYRWFFYLLAGFVLTLLIFRLTEGNPDAIVKEEDYWEKHATHENTVHRVIKENAEDREINSKKKKK